jgi:DNA-binding NtrC family response regulator
MAEAILELLPDCRTTAHSQRQALSTEPLSLLWSGGALPLRDDAIGIGAHPANQISLEDRFVSGFHCRLDLHAGKWRLKDLGSTNGTFVDGMRVQEAELDAGARVKVGSQDLRLEHDAPRALPSLPGLVARDPALRPVLDLLRRAAPSQLPVMILGESGSGKEVAAKAVHELSLRAAGPFVPLNCGAISRELAEAELFGHEKGSFTGAVTSAPGAFGAADGGTLFLDEIGDLPLQLQVKLLRALEAGEVKPVGAPRPRRIDVRIVCATHQDLRARVKDGAFREDLFYRLRGVTVELPPLRARPQDILPLAEHFLPQRSALAADARAALLAHPWPGNVRELRHVVQLAALLSDSPVIRAGALYFDGRPAVAWSPAVAERAELSGSIELRGRTLEELEELAIRAALARNRGNRHAVAEELGIARSTLLRKLDLLGLRE